KEPKPRGSDRRPTRQHIAYLGGILQDDVKHVERRAAFWAKATAKLDALSKRVSPEEVENLRRRWRFVFQSPAAKRFGAISARSSAVSAALRRSRRSRAAFTRCKSSWRRNRRGWLSLVDRGSLREDDKRPRREIIPPGFSLSAWRFIPPGAFSCSCCRPRGARAPAPASRVSPRSGFSSRGACGRRGTSRARARP